MYTNPINRGAASLSIASLKKHGVAFIAIIPNQDHVDDPIFMRYCSHHSKTTGVDVVHISLDV